jgi:hypothetical protein
MSVLHLQLKPATDPSASFFGGLPFLADSGQWPLCPTTGQPQLHLFTLASDFFFTPTISAAHAVSVFVSFDFAQRGNNLSLSRELAINLPEQAGNAALGYAKVLLHEPGAIPCPAPSEVYLPLPVCAIERSPFLPQEIKEEVATPGRGLDVSKFGGIPGWLQDDISLGPKFGYLLQISEFDIRTVSPEHEGIFRDGMGYLLLNRNSRKLTPPCETGHFFIQFT